MNVSGIERSPIVDAHVHFWDPGVLEYPWLSGIPALERRFEPAHYAAATQNATVERIVFVECNCRPSQNLREAEWVEWLAEVEQRIAGIIAYANLSDVRGLGRSLDELQRLPRVRGIRHNIQGEAAGFCLQPKFVEGVREAGRRGLTFDLCATHDQLGDVVQLARQCEQTRLVLDHCGKPSIREGALDPWRARITELAAIEHVCCKVSGLLTEAIPARWREEDLLPYAEHVVDHFGTGRVMYGSDWPVLTLAGRYSEWLRFTRRLTDSWSAAERQRFYHDNATSFYSL